MQGDNIEEFLRREARDFDIRTTPTFEIALQELAEGQHDAVVIQRLVALRLIQKTGLTNLRVIDRPIEGFKQDFCFAVHEGDRATLSLLNEGLAIVVADGTYRYLHAKWFANLQLPTDRLLVVGGDRNFPPFEFLDESGRPTGYNVDLTRAIAREMGLNVEIRLGWWSERLEALKTGKIDVIQGMFYSPGRDLTFDFTPAHTVSHLVAVVRKGEGPAPESVKALGGKRIVVENGDILHDFALENGLEKQITPVDDQEAALSELSDGRYDCALVLRDTALYLIEKHGWSNLVLGKKPLLVSEYCYASAKGQRALLAQFGEGLRVLENSGEYYRIYDKWLGVYQNGSTSFLTALRYSAMVIIPLLFISLAAFVWSWTLRRKVAEKTRALSTSEEYQRAIVACSPVALYIIDLDGNVLSWNSSAERIFGWRADDVMGRRLPIVPEDSQAEFDTLRRLALEEGGFFGKDRMRLKSDGTLFPVSISAALVRSDRGEIIGILNAAEDITQPKRYQSRIEHLNQVLRAIRDVNQLIIHERDRDRLIRECCHLLVANRGYASVLIVLTDDRNRPVTWAMEGLASDSERLALQLKQGVLPVCFTNPHIDQGLFWVEDRERVCQGCPLAENCIESQSLSASLSHEGETFGYLVAAAEKQLIIEKEERTLFSEMAGDFAYALSVMRIEAAQRESESRFRAIVEDAPEPIYIQTEMRFAYLNPKALDLFGAKDARELLGTPVMERVHPDFHEHVRQRIKTLNEDREPVKELLEQQFVRLDGTSVWAETTGQPIVYHGKNGALVFARDITIRKLHELERDRLQTQLTQSQKIESVGRLAGGVAHDYNNMLSVIIGYTEMALDKVPPDDSLSDDLKEVLNAARRSADITRQLLAFARRQTIDPKVIDMNETVEGMLKMLRRLIGEDIDLSWQPGHGRMPVFVDPTQIDQILANLCVNARDAIGGVGKITIETDNRSFDAEYCADHPGFIPGDYIMLAVSDDGCGMDKDTLEVIFEPFFTTKDVGEGTGLGLSTVFGIVKQNNGFINVYSEPGTGTTFRIYLSPYATKDQQVKDREATDIPVGRGETVLVVEDESSILKLAQRILERLGYSVLTAATPDEAIALAKERAGDMHLLITDVVMPEMNGRELSERMKTHYPALKVLFMSGYTANVIAHRGVLDAGVNFIQKPFSNRDLAVKVRDALAS